MFEFSSWLPALRGSRRRRRAPARRGPRPAPRLEVLEERLTLDSGGSFGQLNAGKLVYTSGPLLTSVSVHPIFLQDSSSNAVTPAALQSQLDQFFKAIVTDSYIPTLLSQYDVSPYTIGTGTVGVDDVNVPVAAQNGVITDPQIQQIVQQEITLGNTAAPGTNNLYFVFTPPGDSVAPGGFYGYHSNFLDADTVHQDYYAVMLDPGAPNNLLGPPLNYTPIQELASTAAHELAEAITDPQPNNEWTDPKFGEICDMVVNDTYMQDGFAVQYQFSNATHGSAHAIGTVGSNLFINQLAPPALGNYSTAVPVATFTDLDPTLTASSFVAQVDFSDGFGPSNAQVVGGSNGVYVVMAQPTKALTPGTYGTPFAGDGLIVNVYDTAQFPIAGGAPLAIRGVPYTIGTTGPLNYVADQGGQAHNFNLSVSNGNFILKDFGEEVYQQPVAGTTAINLSTEPGVDSSLTVDYSGGLFSNTINFDGGTGAAVHNLSVVGASFDAATENVTSPTAGNLSLTSGTTTVALNFTGTSQTNLTPTALTNLTLNLPAGAATGVLKDDATGGNNVSELASLGGTPTLSFTDPSAALTINLAKGNNVTVASPDSAYHTPLTITDGGAGQTTVSLNGPITFGAQGQPGNLSVTAAAINVGGSITTVAGGLVTLANSGPLTFAAAANLNAAGAVVQNGAGPVTLAGSITTPATISFASPVKLGGSATLTGRTTTFAGTLDDTPAGLDNLAIQGNAVFKRGLGTGNALGSLTVSGTSVLGGGTVRTAGSQRYTGAVTLGAASTLTALAGGNITFGLTVDGGFALTVNTAGTTTFTGGVGGNVPLVSLTTDAGGSTLLGGGGVTTSAGQTYGDAVQLGAPATLTSSNAGNISFNGSLDGAVDLTVATDGLTSFNGTVGAVTPLASLTTSSTGATALAAAILTKGNQTYGATVTLNGPTVLTSTAQGNLTLPGTVDGNGDLSLSTGGTIALGGAIGGATALNSLTIAAGGTTTLRAGAVSTTGNQSYGNALTLNVATTLASSNNGNITLGGTVNGGVALSVNTGGATTFSAPVGTTTPLSTVTTDGAGSTVLGAVIKTGSGQTYADAVTLAAATSLTSNFGGNLTFGGTVDGAFALTVSTAGSANFNGLIGGTTPLASLTTGSSGHTFLGGAVKTAGGQSYGNALVLAANAALVSTGGGAINLGGTVDGPFALTVTSAGTTTFSGPLGNNTPLGSLATTGTGTTQLASFVKTAGAQSYSSPVVLSGQTSLTSNNGGNLTFSNTVDGAFALSLTTTGAVSFGAAVGASTPLASIATTPSGKVLLGALVQTTGAQTYTNPLTLIGPTNLTSTGGNLTVSGAIDGAFPLALNSAGPATLAGAIGGSTPLASLTTGGRGSVVLSSGAVSTSGAQTYQDAVSFGAATATLNGGTVTFAGPLNLGTGTLNVNGNLALAPTATLSAQLAGTQPNQMGNLVTSGTVDLGGAQLSVSTAPSFTPPPGTTFNLIAPGSGALANTFANLPEGGVFGVNQLTFGITYAAGAAGTTAQLQVLVGIPVQLAFVQTPGSAVAGQPLSPAVRVVAEDANGKLAPVDTSTITLAVAAGPGTLGGTVTARDGAGGAVFSNLVLQKAGSYTLTASAPGLQSATSAGFTVNATVPSALAFAANPANGAAGQPLPPLQVAVNDAFGNGVAGGVPVSLSVSGPGGFSAGATTATVSGGSALFPGLILSAAGTYTVTAQAPGLSPVTSTSFTITAGSPSQTALENSPGSIIAGKALADFKIDVKDRFGNPVSGATVNAAPLGPGAFTAGAASVPVVNGVATFTGLVLQTAGSYAVAVNLAGLPPLTTGHFSVTPGQATQLGFETTPAAVAAGQTLPDVAVDVQDSFGNLIAAATSAVTLAVNGPGTPSGGNTSAQAANGVAVFHGLTLKTAGSYTLTATAANLKLGSTTLTVNPGAGALSFATPPTVATAGQALPDLVVHLQDSLGNPLGSVPITLTVSGPGTVAGGATLAQANAGGIATFSGLVLQKAGTYTLTASAPGQAPTPAASLTVNPGAPGQLVLESSPADTIAGAALGTLKVDVLDAFGNPVGGSVPVALTANGPGALSGSATGSTASGIATFTGLALPKVGSYSLTASAAGLTAATSASFAVTPAAASRLAFELTPSTTTAGAVLPDLKVDAFDAFGNLATSNAPVTLALSGPGTLAAGNTTAALTNGVATFHGLAVQQAGSFSLSAAAAGLTATAPASFTVTPAAASQLVFESLPSGGTAGQPIGGIRVDLRDPYGNLVNSNAQVSLSTGGPAQVTTAAFASGGVATFSGLTLPLAGSYNLIASGAGVAPATVSGLTIAAAPTAPSPAPSTTPTTPGIASSGAPASLRFLTSAPVGHANRTLPTVRVQVLDGAGQPVKAGTLVSLRLSTGTLIGKKDLRTDKNGTVAFQGLKVAKPGHYTLRASSPKLHRTFTIRLTIRSAS